MVSGLDFIFIFLVKTTYPSGEVTGVESVPNHSHLPTTSKPLFRAPSFYPLFPDDTHFFSFPRMQFSPKRKRKEMVRRRMTEERKR